MGKIVISEEASNTDLLRLDVNKKQARLTTSLFKYRDVDTRQIVLHIPSLDISGYGSDEEKAMEMLNFSIDQFFSWITKLSHKQIPSELTKLGWRHIKYKNKEYSQTFVDANGKLNNFNAVAGEVERLTIHA